MGTMRPAALRPPREAFHLRWSVSSRSPVRAAGLCRASTGAYLPHKLTPTSPSGSREAASARGGPGFGCRVNDRSGDPGSVCGDSLPGASAATPRGPISSGGAGPERGRQGLARVRRSPAGGAGMARGWRAWRPRHTGSARLMGAGELTSTPGIRPLEGVPPRSLKCGSRFCRRLLEGDATTP